MQRAREIFIVLRFEHGFDNSTCYCVVSKRRSFWGGGGLTHIMWKSDFIYFIFRNIFGFSNAVQLIMKVNHFFILNMRTNNEIIFCIIYRRVNMEHGYTLESINFNNLNN